MCELRRHLHRQAGAASSLQRLRIRSRREEAAPRGSGSSGARRLWLREACRPLGRQRFPLAVRPARSPGKPVVHLYWGATALSICTLGPLSREMAPNMFLIVPEKKLDRQKMAPTRTTYQQLVLALLEAMATGSPTRIVTGQLPEQWDKHATTWQQPGGMTTLFRQGTDNHNGRLLSGH